MVLGASKKIKIKISFLSEKISFPIEKNSSKKILFIITLFTEKFIGLSVKVYRQFGSNNFFTLYLVIFGREITLETVYFLSTRQGLLIDVNFNIWVKFFSG
jgi:hypothetical protein